MNAVIDLLPHSVMCFVMLRTLATAREMMLLPVVCLTFASFALLVAVDEQVARALGTEWQQDALQHSWQQSEAQQQGPKGGIAHDGFYSKDLQPADIVEMLMAQNNLSDSSTANKGSDLTCAIRIPMTTPS